eukprot:353120-Chlamydomonas_euryale.AAC.3
MARATTAQYSHISALMAPILSCARVYMSTHSLVRAQTCRCACPHMRVCASTHARVRVHTCVARPRSPHGTPDSPAQACTCAPRFHNSVFPRYPSASRACKLTRRRPALPGRRRGRVGACRAAHLSPPAVKKAGRGVRSMELRCCVVLGRHCRRRRNHNCKDRLMHAACRPAVCQPAVCQPAVCQPAVRQPAVCQPAVCQPAVCQPA